VNSRKNNDVTTLDINLTWKTKLNAGENGNTEQCTSEDTTWPSSDTGLPSSNTKSPAVATTMSHIAIKSPEVPQCDIRAFVTPKSGYLAAKKLCLTHNMTLAPWYVIEDFRKSVRSKLSSEFPRLQEFWVDMKTNCSSCNQVEHDKDLLCKYGNSKKINYIFKRGHTSPGKADIWPCIHHGLLKYPS